MKSLGSKLASTLGGSQVGTLKQRRPSSKFFFENGRHRALIFGIQHLLVDPYQVCSYDAPGVNIGPALVTNLNIGTNKAKFKIILL